MSGFPFPAIPLRRIFRVVNGGTPTADGENWDGDVPWVTPVDLGAVNGGAVTGTARTLTIKGLQTGSAAVPGESLIVSTRAPIGYVGEVSRLTAFNQGCRGLVPITPSDIRYYRYQLLALGDVLQSRGQGSTFVELSSESLASIRLASPPFDQQRAIADYLGTETARIDALIEKKRRLIELLEEQAGATAARILGGGGDDLPSGWQWMRARYVCPDITVGVVVDPSSYFVDEGVPFIHGTDIRRGWIDVSNLKFLSVESNALLRKSQLHVDDVIVMRVGEPGRAAVVPPHLSGANAASALIFRRAPRLASAILCGFLNSSLGRSQIESMQYGAAQGVLNVAHALDLRIPLPPEEIQPTVVRHLLSVDDSIRGACALLQRQWDLLQEHRRALITAAVTGELEIPGAAA